jgi:NADH:ubiquinone reductase (H+-translocating)
MTENTDEKLAAPTYPFATLPPEPTLAKPVRVLVLGGGFAGLEVCHQLDDPRYAITLIDRQNHHLFQPLLYQVATAGLAGTDIAQPLRSILSEQKNVTVLLDDVQQCDLDAGQVRTKHQTLGYDYLIIALGAVTGYFGHDEWARHATGLKSLNDALMIRRQVLGSFEEAERLGSEPHDEALLSMIVIGGGPTGVEMAGSLAELSRQVLPGNFRRINPAEAKVYLIEAGPRLLPAFSPELSEYTRQRLENMGVTVLLNTPVQAVEAHTVKLTDRTLRARTIVWAAGVRANPLTSTLKVPTDRAGRIAVAPDLSLPGYANVFAAGDIVSLKDPKGVVVPGVAPAAMQMGRHIAGVIKKDFTLAVKARGLPAPVPRAAYTYFDKGNMATIGRSAAVASAHGLSFRGFIAWLMWLVVHLLFLVGFRNRVIVLWQWMYSYFTYRRGARVIIGAERPQTEA